MLDQLTALRAQVEQLSRQVAGQEPSAPDGPDVQPEEEAPADAGS